MSVRVVARKRWKVVALVAAGSVVATSSLAGAHGGDTTQVHGCVATGSGYLRIIEADESCKRGEIPIDWKIDSGTDLNALRDELENAGGADTAVNETSDPVSWLKLKDVPSGIADGADAVDGGRAADVDCPAGCVSSSEIDGTIGAEKLSGGITSGLIEDGTITAADLGSGAVTSDKIAAEHVTNATLRSVGPDGVGGAVTTAKINHGSITSQTIGSEAVTTSKLDGSSLNEVLLHRSRAVTASTLSDGAVIGRTIREGAITASKLDPIFLDSLARAADLAEEAYERASFDRSLLDDDAASRGVNDGDGLVSWWNLEDVPSAVVGREASDLDCSVCVSNDEIQSLDTAKLTGTITGSLLQDGTVTATDLADGAVSLAKLASDVLAEFGVLEAEITALELRFDHLGSPVSGGSDLDRVHSERIVGRAPGVTGHTMGVSMAGSSLSLAGGMRHTVLFDGVTGATPGDGVYIAPPAMLGNLLYAGAQVTGPGQVAMYLYNPDPAPVDLLATDVFELFVTDLTP